MSYLEHLDKQKADAASRLREILDAAATEQRDLSTEDDTNLAKIDEDITRINEQRARITDLEERAAQADEARAVLEPVLAKVEKRVIGNSDREKLATAFRSLRETGAGSVFQSDLSQAFLHEMERRALSTPGGSAIPETFIDQVTVYERTATPMLNPAVVRILNTRSGESLTLPRLTADPNFGGTLTTEAAAITELDPTISSVTLNAYKYTGITLWSAELDQDEVINLDDLIADSTGRQLGLNIGTALTTGDGSDKPNGFITAATNGGTATGTANNTFLGPDDLIDLFYGRAEPYRAVGIWQASNSALAKIRKFKNSNDDYIWVAGLGGQPDTILNRPVFENPAMAAVASASKSVAFGDFQRYWVRRVTPVRVEVSRDYKFSTDQVAVKTVERVDGDLVDTAAVAFLVSANA